MNRSQFGASNSNRRQRAGPTITVSTMRPISGNNSVEDQFGSPNMTKRTPSNFRIRSLGTVTSKLLRR